MYICVFVWLDFVDGMCDLDWIASSRCTRGLNPFISKSLLFVLHRPYGIYIMQL